MRFLFKVQKVHIIGIYQTHMRPIQVLGGARVYSERGKNLWSFLHPTTFDKPPHLVGGNHNAYGIGTGALFLNVLDQFLPQKIRDSWIETAGLPIVVLGNLFWSGRKFGIASKVFDELQRIFSRIPRFPMTVELSKATPLHKYTSISHLSPFRRLLYEV